LKQSRGRRGRRVVVDTSVVISGIAAFKGSFVEGRTDSGDLLYHWLTRGKFTWLVTPEILEEYREVANRLRVRRSVAGRMINLLKEEAKEVVVERIFEISPDPGDNCFCACAQEGTADFLVTLNPSDFPQRRLSAKVVSPSELLRVLRQRARVECGQMILRPTGVTLVAIPKHTSSYV
jgi:putative PIN family toxin of toxin-antitoxin system